jgi:uncharacterized membrane protein (DUF485 family)
MSSAIYERIRNNPKFEQLVRTRSRFAWTLAITVLAVFYGFVMLVAFRPALLGMRVADGSVVTVGYAAGLFMFVSFWLLTALYVRRANREFDTLTGEVVAEARAALAAASVKEIA